MKHVIVWITCCLIFNSILWANDGWHSPHGAKHLVGERATICGLVASARYVESSQGSPTYINLGPDYPNQVFTAVVWESDRHKFEYQPESLEGAICVSGEVEMFRDVPRIVVRSPDQISQ